MRTIQTKAAEGIRQFPATTIVGDLMEQLADEIDASPYAANIKWAGMWKEVGDFAIARYEEICETLDVRTVADPPYDTKDGCQRMFADISNGIYYVQTFTNNNPHPYWECPVWKAFRTIHDIDGHVMAGGDFTIGGEERTFQVHVAHLPREYRPVVFSETLFQVASTNRNHRFPEFHKASISKTAHEAVARLTGNWKGR